MTTVLCTDLEWLLSNEAFHLYSACMFEPSLACYRERMQSFAADPGTRVFVAEQDGKRIAILALRLSGTVAEIAGIAVAEKYRRLGIGSRMLDDAMRLTGAQRVVAETDDEAVAFYRGCGFAVETIVKEYPDGISVRYLCLRDGLRQA